MEDEWNQRQRFTKSERRATFPQFPFRRIRPIGLILALLPDLDSVLRAAIGECFEFQDADRFSQFDGEGISSIRTFDDFTESDQRDDIAAMDALRLPVQDVFSLIAHDISALLAILLPVNECAAATDG